MRYAGRVGRSIALLFCVVLTIACRSANAPTDSAARSGLDVSYGVDAARPRTSFRFHLPSTGDAELYLGAPLAASGADTLGHFRAPVDPEARADIAKLVDDAKLLSRSGGPSATAEGAGQLSLTSGSAKAELSLVSADAPVTELRAKLDAIMTKVANHPVRALRMALALVPSAGGYRPEITLTQVGAEPLDVLFCDPAPSGPCLQATATTASGSSVLSRADAADLVARGVLPSGVTAVAPGTTYRIALAPITGRGEVTATVLVWFAGPGLARAAVELRAQARTP